MSNHSPDYQSPGPLSVGNVISAAARIYRDRFVVYYKLALIAYLWCIVPIYGWAKFMAISGLLSRLAYGEVSGKPESVREARRYINPRLWTFFGTALLVGLIFFGWYLLFTIIAALILGVLGTLASQDGAGFLWIIFGLLAIVGFILFLISLLWLNSRLYLADLAIAIENQPSAGKAINRSWQLTKQFIWRIILISFVAGLVTMPVSLLIQFLDALLRLILMLIVPSDSPIFALVYFPIFLVLYFVIIATLVPFWQAIKAVVYYDLRIRREGIDIQLRDSI
ncbi:MAG: hypothetical protein AB4063_02300 [Crocosphaera sp.]